MLKAKRAAVALRRQTGKLHLSTAAMALAVAAGFAVPAMAQQTTSSITGLILRPDGEPAVGTRVEILHVPTGTRATTTVNAEGRFNAPGLRIGGPYSVRLVAEGVRPETVENIFLRLGSPYAVDLVLAAGSEVEELVVMGERLPDAGFGSVVRFDQANIRRQPVIERRLQEIVRQDPSVYVDLGTNNLRDQGISILGFNTRFNSVVVAGIDQIDDFGIGFTGLPTQRSPISLDAIDSLAVEKTPFNVENGQFQGGQINIITKSGNNEFSGSAFATYQGGFLRGTRSGDEEFNDDGFQELNYGATLGGPIVKDKLFFFFSYERFRGDDELIECPAGFGCANEELEVPLSVYEQVRQIAIDLYDYDPLSYDQSFNFEDEENKYLGKIDWNIVENHRASLTYQRTESNFSSQPGPQFNGGTGVSAPSAYNVRRDSVPQLYAVQIFSDWTDNFSTEIKFGYKEQISERVPLGEIDFAQVSVEGLPNGNGTVQFGPRADDQNFFLDSDRLQYKLKAEYSVGDHTITAGYERDKSNIFNTNLSNSRGTLRFQDPDGPAGPLTGLDSFRLRNANSYTVQSAFSGDILDAAADWGFAINTFYIQDEWDATPDLQLLFGFRYERYDVSERPRVNTPFLQRYGILNNETLDGRDVWSPRFGFNYELDERTTIRGGAGIFAGGTPATWISNSFREDGTSVLQASFTRPTSPTAPLSANAASALNNVDPRQIPQGALNVLAAGTDASVTALDPDFEIPSQWRFSLGIDREMDLGVLGDGWRFSAEAIYSKVRQGLQWQDLRLIQDGEYPDGRPRYILRQSPLDQRSTNTAADVPQDVILTNTELGRSLVVQGGIEKSWQTNYGDFDAHIGYAFIDSKDISPANDVATTRSVFRTGAYNDINNPDLAPSIQAIRHNGTWSAGYTKEYWGGFRTTFSFFGQHRAGTPFSFTFNDPADLPAGLERINPGTDPTSRDRILFYVPSGPTDPNVRYLPPTATAPEGNRGASYADLLPVLEQWGLLEDAGGPSRRNRQRSRPVNLVDFKFTQEIPAPLDGHRASVEFDIRNVLNLINNDWGQVQQFDIREPLVDVFYDPRTDQYVYRNINTSLDDEVNFRSRSVWSARIGVRYQF